MRWMLSLLLFVSLGAHAGQSRVSLGEGKFLLEVTAPVETHKKVLDERWYAFALETCGSIGFTSELQEAQRKSRLVFSGGESGVVSEHYWSLDGMVVCK